MKTTNKNKFKIGQYVWTKIFDKIRYGKILHIVPKELQDSNEKEALINFEDFGA